MKSCVTIEVNLVNSLLGLLLDQILELVHVPRLHRGEQLRLHDDECDLSKIRKTLRYY